MESRHYSRRDGEKRILRRIPPTERTARTVATHLDVIIFCHKRRTQTAFSPPFLSYDVIGGPLKLIMIVSKRIAAVLVTLSISGGKYWEVGSTEEGSR